MDSTLAQAGQWFSQFSVLLGGVEALLYGLVDLEGKD